MKVPAINIYSQRNLVQKSVTFGEIDEWPDDPWISEKDSITKEFNRKYNKLCQRHENEEISDRVFIREKDALFEWARNEKDAIMRKYRELCINYKPEEIVVKKPFWKRLLHIK